MLLSQCRGLKQVLGLVYHLLNVGLLIWHPLQTAYKTENSTTFWCFIFSLWPYFQGFICFFVCLRTFDAHFHSVLIGQNWQPCRRGATGVLEAEFKLRRCDCKLSFPFRPAIRAPRESLLTSNGDQRTLRLLCRILGLKFDSLTIFCADMEPLSKYSPVMLQFSPATVILTENPGVGCWWSEILTYLFKVYVLTIFFIKISI